MRVLIVNTYYYPHIIGGTEVSVKKLAEGLSEKGIDVSVLCSDVEDKFEIINGVNVYRLKLKNIYQPIELRGANPLKKVIGRANDIYNKFNKRKINELINKIKPNVIHVNNIYGISPVIWEVAKENNIKLIHTIRDYYLMCPKISMLKKGKQCKEKNIVCKLFTNLNRKLSKNVDFVTAPSQYTLDCFIKEGFFSNAISKKVFNAIDYNISNVNNILNTKLNNNDSYIKFVFIGTLTHNKGLDLLLEAFSQIKNPNAKLTIAGKGELENMVIECTKNDNRIAYKGFIGEEEINAMLKESDVLVAPSIWNEPFGRVVIDAYKNAMPVIAGKYGGLKEIVKDGMTGLLIEPKNKEEFINALNYFNDKKHLKSMLNNCVDELKNYSLKYQVEQFIKIYEELVES